jgi:membrane protein DedA with SNARE-associated domain
MDTIGHLIGLAAASPWALALLGVVLVIDGFFPFVPGETLVVATAAALGAGGGDPWIVLAVAVPAALAGDVVAYHLGRHLGLDRWIGRRGGRVAAAFERARRRLAENPAPFLLTGKFIPFVRAAVPMAAGANRMPLRRYLPLAAASVTIYAGMHVAIGALVGTAAGAVLGNPLISLGISLAVGLALGLVIDRVGKRLGARGAGDAGRPGRAAAAVPAAAPPRVAVLRAE